MPETGSNLAHLATITSRPEALVIASALEHAGIEAFLDGMYHASADPRSVALGGHRLHVYADQWEEASDIVREIGLPEAPVAFHGARRAVLRLIALWLGFVCLCGLPAMLIDARAIMAVALGAVSTITLQVDPRGQNDYFLARPRDD